MDEMRINQDQWAAILAEFSERHLEEFVVVRLVGDEIGEQYISDGGLPLQGVSLDYQDSKPVVRVILGQEAVDDPDSIAHEIEAREINLVRGDEPGEETLIVTGREHQLFIEAAPLNLPVLESD